jgi:beta-glucanase (GH16 family)
LTRLRLSRAAVLVAALALGGMALAWFPSTGSRDGGDRSSRADVVPPAASQRHRFVWNDEFTGPAGARPSPARWRIATGERAGQQQHYTQNRENVSLDGRGHLVITARRAASRRFTSALLETKGLFQKRYGRIEARIRIPRGRGLWPTFWAGGSDVDRVGWPSSGEIDVMENLGSDPFSVSGSVHGPERHTRNGYAVTNVTRSPVSLATGFHVYGVAWRRHRITFTLDGARYAEVTPASLSRRQRWVFEKPFFLMLNLAVADAPPEAPDAHTRFPARMLVDWVRVRR